MALFSNYMSRYPSQFDPELSADDPRQKALMIDRLRQLANERLNAARSQASAPTLRIGSAGRGLPSDEDAYFRGMQQDIDIANYARSLGGKAPLETGEINYAGPAGSTQATYGLPAGQVPVSHGPLMGGPFSPTTQLTAAASERLAPTASAQQQQPPSQKVEKKAAKKAPPRYRLR